MSVFACGLYRGDPRFCASELGYGGDKRAKLPGGDVGDSVCWGSFWCEYGGRNVGCCDKGGGPQKVWSVVWVGYVGERLKGVARPEGGCLCEKGMWYVVDGAGYESKAVLVGCNDDFVCVVYVRGGDRSHSSVIGSHGGESIVGGENGGKVLQNE